ncbi:MAG TPA: spore coat protein CotJB [Firmicutes bacterium]|jgi:spore coat protein JB|nr:spore coat protein CotJB [Bacillota bacterium]
MHTAQLKMLNDLQALEFTGYDFHLYLNTHPNDLRALAEFSRVTRESERLRNMYSTNYGPLMAGDNANQPCWRWTEEPWPWEIDY